MNKNSGSIQNTFLRKNQVIPFRLCMLSFVMASLIHTSAHADSEFESIFLHKNKNGATPDVFLYRNSVTPGLKTVDITVNNKLVDQFSIRFIEDRNQQIVFPCLSYALLNTLGIKTSLYQGWKNTNTSSKAESTTAKGSDELSSHHQCEDITTNIPVSKVAYDDTLQILSITVPQEAIDSQRFTMISPKEWDNGTPSLRTSYNGYFYHSRLKNISTGGNGENENDNSNQSSYVSLNSIASIGPWRMYSLDSFSKNADSQWESNHDRLYMARDIAYLRSKLSAGDLYTYTPSNIMGTIPLRGITLSTSDRMTLDNQFSYAPVIRGTARTNARLVVRQNSNIIYSTTLTPGPFKIDDLYSAQVGADLDVTVEEADGTKQVFRVPYTSLPNMIRPGAMRYNTAIGQYRNNGQPGDKPLLGSASIEYGFESFTLNNTLLAAENYQSLGIGAAWNIGAIGAFSLDLAQARYKESWDSGQTRTGSAMRMLYAKQFDATDTGLQILGYQYRSKDFLEFSEFVNHSNYQDIDGYEYGDDEWNRRRRSRIEMSVNQGLQSHGSLYFSLSQDRYYGTSAKSTSMSGGFGTQIGYANISISYTYTKDDDFNDNQISLNISMPLNWGEQQSNYSSLSYGLTRNSDNQYSQSVNYTASALDNRLNYSANVQKDAQSNTSESASIGYNANAASLTGSVSRSKYNDQFSVGMNGGIVLYKGGAILSQSLGDTIGIVETPGASGIGVSSNNSEHTDRWGRAIITYLSPYRYNTVSLDTTQTEGVELKESSRKVVPTEGAAVLLRFATRVGRRAMVVIESAKNIPLGALVRVEGEQEDAGIVGNNGLTYLSGLDAPQEQHINVTWGDDASQHCSFNLPAQTETQRAQTTWYKKIAVNCR